MIHNLHILTQPDDEPSPAEKIRLAQEEILIAAHRNGAHPYGEKRRSCPLCQMGD